MNTVLITGGGGFIGRAVVKELLRRDCKVRSFDLVQAHAAEGVDYEYVGSILDPYQVANAIRGCDYVIHLAAALGVKRTEANRLECLYINIQGTVNVLEGCAKEKVKKIVFASSSEVYGESKIHPIVESVPLNPKSNYAVTKIVGEEYIRAYSETYPIAYNIVRLFNVYGEHQREEFVVPNFIKSVANDQSPCVYGEGKQVRCFCHVEDVARGIANALVCPIKGEVFNIGNDSEPISVKDLAEKVIEISRKPLKPKFVPYNNSDRNPERDIITRIPSIEKAKALLGYKHTIPLGEGLRRMLKFYGEGAKCGRLTVQNNV